MADSRFRGSKRQRCRVDGASVGKLKGGLAARGQEDTRGAGAVAVRLGGGHMQATCRQGDGGGLLVTPQDDDVVYVAEVPGRCDYPARRRDEASRPRIHGPPPCGHGQGVEAVGLTGCAAEFGVVENGDSEAGDSGALLREDVAEQHRERVAGDVSRALLEEGVGLAEVEGDVSIRDLQRSRSGHLGMEGPRRLSAPPSVPGVPPQEVHPLAKADNTTTTAHVPLRIRIPLLERLASSRLEYSAQGKEKGWLELGVDAAKGVWARTENTASWVGVHQGARGDHHGGQAPRRLTGRRSSSPRFLRSRSVLGVTAHGSARPLQPAA